ncbi:hypothetical protein [Martelella soudanensis]|uniref:hypothetical protein n=1 Tax=unclassified Martelella TaxID=2629616 RepID=UPI0015DE3A99|nr:MULTISPECIES: hypothetical protein [unclassified Martelella]
MTGTPQQVLDETGRWESFKACFVALLILAVCGVFGSQIPKIYTEPGAAGLGARGLPGAATGLAAGLALILLAMNLPEAVRTMTGAQPLVNRVPVLKLGFLIILSFAYVWAITLFQYVLPTLFAMSALLALFGSRGIVRLIVVPLVAICVYYFTFFILLGLFEPPGKLLSYDSYSFSLHVRRMIGL